MKIVFDRISPTKRERRIPIDLPTIGPWSLGGRHSPVGRAPTHPAKGSPPAGSSLR
jgi:hypothetical protein